MSAVTRIPLNTLAIGFGLAGLAEAWSVAGRSLELPVEIAQAFWLVAAIAWITLLAAHAIRGARSEQSLATQLRHPVQGPIAALIPVTAMLLAYDLADFSTVGAIVLFLVAVIASAAFAAWIVAFWLRGGLQLDSVHGGWLLPTVAAGLVGADTAARVGLTGLGWGLFGIGVFFWAIMTLLVLARLAFGSPLPEPLVPTTAILLAPPAVAGIALFELEGLSDSIGAELLAGLAALLALVQLALVVRYRRLHFSLGFWSFTFPVAAAIVQAMLWLRLTAVPGWQGLTIALLVLVTALVGAIAARSLADAAPHRRRGAAEATLLGADAAAAEEDARA